VPAPNVDGRSVVIRPSRAPRPDRASPRQPSSGRTFGVTLTLLVSSTLTACGEQTPVTVQGRLVAPIVYDEDDRRELYEQASDPRASIADAAVALVPRSALAQRRGPGLAPGLSSWQQEQGLCPGEPFGDQPVAAFCSGVLVDWDLVLTVAHCVEGIPLDEVAMVMGFYYVEPGVLGTQPGDVLQPIEVVAQSHGVADDEALLDYAWVRLARPAPAWRQPAPLRAAAQPLAVGEALALMGSAGGTPLKLDFGGTVLDGRPDRLDYFAASTDTSRGSSGAGAYDPELALAGVLARGGEDFIESDQGCLTTRREPSGTDTWEELTYVTRALEELCARGERTSSLCRADCGDPCQALPRPSTSDDGCALAAGPAPAPRAGSIAMVLLAGASWLRRRRHPAFKPSAR
jgi:trypsin-like peptidase